MSQSIRVRVALSMCTCLALYAVPALAEDKPMQHDMHEMHQKPVPDAGKALDAEAAKQTEKASGAQKLFNDKAELKRMEAEKKAENSAKQAGKSAKQAEKKAGISAKQAEKKAEKTAKKAGKDATKAAEETGEKARTEGEAAVEKVEEMD